MKRYTEIDDFTGEIKLKSDVSTQEALKKLSNYEDEKEQKTITEAAAPGKFSEEDFEKFHSYIDGLREDHGSTNVFADAL